MAERRRSAFSQFRMRHSRSQDGPHSLRSLPRSSGSVDSIPLQVSMSGGPPPRLADSDRSRKISGDQGPMGDSGVENTSNMNVRKAKAMFEEISRSNENLLDIGKSAQAPSRQRQTPRQESLEKNEFTYTETNNNYTKKAPVSEPQISGVQVPLDNSGNSEFKQPLINRFTSSIPHHTHSRSLPVEYEERQESRNLAPTRPSDPSRRPRSAHYLTEVPNVDPRSTRRVSPDTSYNQAHLMRSFRVSKSQGRADYGSAYDGDAESDPGSERYRQPSTRRSIEELGYVPVTVSSGMGIRASAPADGIMRSSTLPANEMREAAKRYHEQLLRSHPSSYRYSMGQPVDQPRLKRSSSFGSRSQSGGSVSADEQPASRESETGKNSAEADNVFKPEVSEAQTTTGIQLSEAPSQDSGNSILSRLLREHSANNSGIVLGKIEEETQAHRVGRRPVTVKAADIDAKPAVAEALGDLGRNGQDSQSTDRRVERGITVKTVAVSSSVTPSTNVPASGTGERGTEYVQGLRKSSFDRFDADQRPRAYQTDRAAAPQLGDYANSGARRQANQVSETRITQQSVPVSIGQPQQAEPLILDLDRSPKGDRKDFDYKEEPPVVLNEIAQSEEPVSIAHDKEPSTDSCKELREIEEASREPHPVQEGAFDEHTQDIETLPPPPDELLADSPPEREKPQRTINRKKRDIQTIQSSSRNSSCVSTDSTASTATADSGIGIRPFRSTDSSPRTSPLADNHSSYEYGEEKPGQTFKGSQEISDEDEGMPAEPPEATSTPERSDNSFTESKVTCMYDSTITYTPGSSAPNSRPGSATFMGPKFEELDSEKSKLIESMREKIRELKQQELEITEEIKTNEVLGNRVRSMIEARAKQTEFAKYELFIGELNNIVALLLSLTQRLHRYELMLQDLDISEEEDKNKRDELIRKIDKLKNQHEEACRLRDVNDRRGENVANFLEKYCTEEEYADFQYYVDMKSQLALMQSEIKEKVKLGEERLKALECTGVEWTS